MSTHLTAHCFVCGETDGLTLYHEVDSFALCPDCAKRYGKPCPRCKAELTPDDMRYGTRGYCESCWTWLKYAGLGART